jgi:hypothetical protein
LNITIHTDGEVFTDSEDENMKWSEIGAVRAIRVRTVLKKNSDAVEIKDLKRKVIRKRLSELEC